MQRVIVPMSMVKRFKKLCTIDVSYLSNVLHSSSILWDEIDKRQKRFKVHLHTKCIFLREGNLKSNDLKYIDHHSLKDFSSVFDSIGIDLKHVYNATFVLMLSGSTIEPHVDSGHLLSTLTRVHVPIITNKDVLFTVGGETINMKAGEVWAINNLIEHSVINKGADRVHLIFDYKERE